LCCGSAGTYNIVHADIARRLRDRKIARIEQLEPDVIAAGNIGCMTQIATGTAIPVVHPVELLDWSTGGPKPVKLKELDRGERDQNAAADERSTNSEPAVLQS
jgi:glycolate oxidase iron-sulfur subunit